MIDAALGYAARGWHIFPLKPGLKVPLTKHGVKDATIDEGTIKAWWTRWPNANIGLACGPHSGIYVVDVDLDMDKGIDGWASLKDLSDDLGDAPQTVTQASPRGGAHFLFKTDKPPKNKNSFRPGIDIRSTGYYIVLAPSVHPNGKEYMWTREPGIFDLAEFPEAFRPENDKPVLPWESKKPITAETRPAAPRDEHENAIIERASLYLRECDPAVDGQSGGEKLLWAARSLVVGFELSEATALNLLWSEYNPRCNPVYDPSNPAHAKEYRHKVSQVVKTPGQKPSGWLLDEYRLRGTEGDEALIRMGEGIARDLLASAEPLPAPAAGEITPIRSKRDKEATWTDTLLNPPGLVGELVGWINATAGCYQPKLAVAAALTACGALFGRKVRDISNGRTNVYMMGVAHSSAGKDHPADCIEQLFAAAGASDYLGGSRVTSDSAIELALETCPIQLFCWDEVGHMFASIKQAGGSGGAQHLRTIVPALMQLYSSPHKLYIGKQKAQENVRRIDQPHVCVWGLTSPDVLYAGLSKSELRDGWLGRQVCVISHDRPRYQIQEMQPPPDSLVQMTQAWIMRTIPPPENEGNISGCLSCYQIMVPTQPVAMQLFELFRDECHNRMIDADNGGDDCQYLWGKGLQNARRIALILAAGERYDNAEITEFHAEYAIDFIRNTILDFSSAIESNISDSQFEADKQRLYKLIQRSGRTGITRSDLTNRTFWIRDRKMRESYLQDLVDGGKIDAGRKPGERAERYWKHPYGVIATEGK